MHSVITGGAGFLGSHLAGGPIMPPSSRWVEQSWGSHVTATAACAVLDTTYRMTGLSRRVVV